MYNINVKRHVQYIIPLNAGWVEPEVQARLQAAGSKINDHDGKKDRQPTPLLPLGSYPNYRWEKKLYLRHYSGLPGRLANGQNTYN